MKDRIRQLMESQHMNQQSFAAFLGLAPATLSSILQERTRPTLNTVEAICAKMPNVNLAWLLNGTGDMFVQSGQSSDLVQDESLSPSSVGAPSQGSPAASPKPSVTPLELSFDNAPIYNSGASASTGGLRQPRRTTEYSTVDMKNIDKPSRRITEIRVFFDDQTWESFVPKR